MASVWCLEYFVHSEHDFSETLTNRREFQRTMISFHGLENSGDRINKYAYIFRVNENKCVSKYILNQSINIEEYKQQEPKEAFINFPKHSKSRKTSRKHLSGVTCWKTALLFFL